MPPASEEERSRRIYIGDLIEFRVVSPHAKHQILRAPRKRFGKMDFSKVVILQTNHFYHGFIADKYRVSRQRLGRSWKDWKPGQPVTEKPFIIIETHILYHVIVGEDVLLFDSRAIRYSGVNAFNFDIRLLQRGTPSWAKKKNNLIVSA